MIFVCVGSREYQFDRLIIEIDRLVEEGKIKDEVFAQIGSSNYIPKFIKYDKFISQDMFNFYLKQADIIISHAGTGVLVNSIKLMKKTIAVPRDMIFKEHVDNHQFEICEILHEENYLKCVKNVNELSETISQMNKCEFKKFKSLNKIPDLIIDFIDQEVKK